MRSFRTPLLVGAALLLASCATVPPQALPPGSFSLVARVAVRYGDEAASGRVTWQHSGAADELVISTPLGQGVAEITRRDGVYTLVAANGERHTATDPERLTQQVLGYAVPLDGLSDWVQGRPEPGVAAVTRYDGDRLAELRQRGWLIDYSGSDERPPKRVRVTRGDLDIRLVIDEWELPP
ncbi:MAG TPA: lipoprotein insertase outer membrane protein LolB [Burkholderiales bacterium]|nr:lipoprotein insertase outer membrane protein LolB [Burkholderiales bacterium]